MKPATGKLKLNLHRELRLALLAAMETCWVFAILEFLASLTHATRGLTPLPLFIAYWIALVAGRILPQSKQRWVVLQAFAIAIAAITILIVVRVELYPVDWSDLTWLPRFVPTLLSFADGLAAEHIVSVGVLYVFLRGLGLAQRPLTLWFIGLQFRIGVVVFFLLMLVAGFIRPSDPSPWIFVYFFISLLAIALARIEEMGINVRYGPRWAITLLGGVTLVLIVGVGILQVFTVSVAEKLLMIFLPLWVIASAVIMIVAIPFGFLADWLIRLLQPLFTNVNKMLQSLSAMIPANNDATRQLQDTNPLLPLLVPMLKIAFVLGVLAILGFLLARALNRRMKQYEDELFIREFIGAEAEDTVREIKKKPTKPRSHAQRIAAENIRRIYAALVARAADAGVPRRVDETPYEFLPRMQSHWQTESDDLHDITEAYVAVHYAERDAPSEQLSRVREAWKRVEKTLRRET
jgi:hypothetical protein